MAFKFYIDDQLTDQPDNDMQLLTTLRRDSDFGGFFTTQEVVLTYSGNNNLAAGTISGYSYLKSKFDSGTCNIVNITIYDEVNSLETYRVYTGTIIVPNMEIQEHQARLSSKIDDNSFYSYVKNNSKIPFNLYSGRTKNGELITAPSVYQVDMFDSASGTYLSGTGSLYRGYKVYDVINFLVGAISDNKVAFSSDYLANVITPLFIFDGSALANPNTDPAITVSFDTLYQELRKLYNLSLYIDQTNPDAPVLRIEHASWFFIGTNVLTFTEPKDIRTSVKASKIYGTVNVGSNFNPGGSAANVYTWIKGTSYFGWKPETYTPAGQCNTDAVQDLVNDFKISSNAINDQVNGVTQSNLEDTFLVECENVDSGLLTAQAKQYSTYAVAPVKYYNIGLNNVNKITNHGGNFQSALNNTQSGGTNEFHASMGSDITLIDQTGGSGLNFPQTHSPLPFADEFGGPNYDPGNNYSNTLYHYTVPVPGNYSFNVNLVMDFDNFKECTTGAHILHISTGQQIFTPVAYGYRVALSIVAYADATLTTVLDSVQVNLVNYVNTNGYVLPLSFTTNLTVNNVVIVSVVLNTERFAPAVFGLTPLTSAYAIVNCSYSTSEPRQLITALAESYFECNGTPDGGLVLAPYDPQLFRVKLHEFEYDINPTDFRSIQAVPLGMFTLIKDGQARETWIEELQHNNWTGRTRVKLISNDASTT